MLLDALKQANSQHIQRQMQALYSIERYWAYPGYGVLNSLQNYLDQALWHRAQNLVTNTIAQLNQPRTKAFKPFETPLDFLDPLKINPSEHQANHKPCFDVLIIHPQPLQYFYTYYNALMGMQTAQDETYYDIFMVTNLADATTALLNNPNIQVVVTLSGCSLKSDYEEANQIFEQFCDSENHAYPSLDDTALHVPTMCQKIRPELSYFYISETPFMELPQTYFAQFNRVFYYEFPFKDLHYACLRSIRDRLHAPFYQALHAYSQKPKSVFHALPIARGSSLKHSRWVHDFYEFYGHNIFDAETSSTQGGLDSLLNPKGAIKSAQNKAETAFGSQHTYFVTNGTSTSNKIVMQANLKPGDIVFVSTDCHKSVPYGVILSGADVFFMQTNAVEQYDLYGAVDLAQILTQMQLLKEAGQLHRLKQIVLTNSTFDGLLYDVEAYMMSILAIKPDIIFHWDEAWYAHAHFNPLYQRRHAMSITQKLHKRFASDEYREAYQQAQDKTGLPDPDKVVLRVYATQSTHKTLSSFRQGSMIHINDQAFNEDRFLEAYYTHTSTSPNYQILASLDIARRQMMIEGYDLTLKTIELAMSLRHKIHQHPCLTQTFKVLNEQDIYPETPAQPLPENACFLDLLTQHQQPGMLIDPTRITLEISRTGLTGNQFKKLLIDKYNIQLNKTSRCTVLFIVNIGATTESINYLISVLEDIHEQFQYRTKHAISNIASNQKPAMPLQRCYCPKYETLKNVGRIRQAYYDAFEEDHIEYLPLSQNIIDQAKAGQTWVSASFVTPYPPGFPLFVPGQIIDYASLLYFSDIINDEIHGFHKDQGLKVFSTQFLKESPHDHA